MVASRSRCSRRLCPRVRVNVVGGEWSSDVRAGAPDSGSGCGSAAPDVAVADGEGAVGRSGPESAEAGAAESDWGASGSGAGAVVCDWRAAGSEAGAAESACDDADAGAVEGDRGASGSDARAVESDCGDVDPGAGATAPDPVAFCSGGVGGSGQRSRWNMRPDRSRGGTSAESPASSPACAGNASDKYRRIARLGSSGRDTSWSRTSPSSRAGAARDSRSGDAPSPVRPDAASSRAGKSSAAAASGNTARGLARAWARR